MADIITYGSHSNIPQLIRRWPSERAVPQLLIDVADYIADKESGSLGYFSLNGYRVDDYWNCQAGDMWPYFAGILSTGSGTAITQWFPDGPNSAGGPIVMMGDDAHCLAPSLESFLALWCLADNVDDQHLIGGQPIVMPHDLVLNRAPGEFDNAAPDARIAFAAFLEKRLGAKLESFLVPQPDSAALDAFIDNWEPEHKAKLKADPTLQAIAKLLDRYIPRGKEIYEYVSLSIKVCGDRCEISLDPPLSPAGAFPEEAAVIPLVMQAREERAGGIHAPRGLWHTGQIRLHPEGYAEIIANWDPDWDGEPVFRDGSKPTVAQIAADLARFPKADNWMEPWMG